MSFLVPCATDYNELAFYSAASIGLIIYIIRSYNNESLENAISRASDSSLFYLHIPIRLRWMFLPF